MLNVLILEDDFIIASDIKELVHSTGCYRVYIASNTQDALKIAREFRIHIIISDIQIKGDTDGIETVGIIQKLCNSQVFFITSFSDIDTLQRASKVNFVGYLLKPFKEEELLASLQLCAMKVEQLNSLVLITENYHFEPNTQKIFIDHNEVELTQKEKQLFLLLWSAKDSIVPFEIVDETIWQEVSSGSTRRQLFYRLRSKLPLLSFETVRQQGYRLSV